MGAPRQGRHGKVHATWTAARPDRVQNARPWKIQQPDLPPARGASRAKVLDGQPHQVSTVRRFSSAELGLPAATAWTENSLCNSFKFIQYDIPNGDWLIQTGLGKDARSRSLQWCGTKHLQTESGAILNARAK